jgi:hypothetical protein
MLEPLETLRREREEIERQYAALRQENETLRKLIQSDDYFAVRKKTQTAEPAGEPRSEERPHRNQQSSKQNQFLKDEIDEEFYLDNDSSEENRSERSPPQPQSRDSDMDDSSRSEVPSSRRRQSMPKLNLVAEPTRPFSGAPKRHAVVPPRPSSAIVHPNNLFTQSEGSEQDLTSLPHLLWKGGILWKIPFNGRGLPERRLVMIKRVTRPTAKSKPVRILGPDLLFAPAETSTPRTGAGVGYISFPPTVIWANPEKPDDLSNARELSLSVGAHIVEGHQSPAFWKTQSRGHHPLSSPL